MKYLLLALTMFVGIYAQESLEKVSREYVEIFIFVFVIAIGVISRHHILKKKNLELQKLQKELIELNQSLESKIEKAVANIKEKDAYLLHQSRLAQMGEMLSMIAHQWTQPLASISTIQIAMKTAIELEKYDLSDLKEREEFLSFLDKKSNKLGVYVQSLSQIISDFSDFYRPNKQSRRIIIDEVVKKAYKLIEDSLKNSQIKVNLSLSSKNMVDVHKNEFIQVILNIINNARDQLIENSIKNGYIDIKSYDRDNKVYLEISDNAKGIDEEVIDKIFDPYFSTKLEKNGTGLGLYMSKVIIKDYHNGSINAKNTKDGAVFVIELNRYKEEKIDV